jgi:hypothetical protein
MHVQVQVLSNPRYNTLAMHVMMSVPVSTISENLLMHNWFHDIGGNHYQFLSLRCMGHTILFA